MVKIIIILLQAVLSRMSGGGFGAEKLHRRLKMLPEILFALVFAATILSVSTNWFLAVFVFVWCFLWMETGHGVVLPWGEPIPDGSFKDEMLNGRKQTLTPVVDFLARRLGISTERPDGVYSVNYCRLFMAVKGFLIGLPVGGVVLAVLWPLGYEIGKRLKNAELCEILSGAGAGIAIVTFIILTN